MKEAIEEKIYPNIEENIAYIKEILKDNMDIVYREFYIHEWKAALIYIDGMADKILLDDYVLETLMINSEKVNNINNIKERLLTVSDLKELNSLKASINAMLSGETMLLIDELEVCYVIATRLWPNRGISEPSAETVVRGSREGFSETLRFNTVLVRRRIRDTRLRVKPQSVGVRSKTDVALMYIEDIVNKSALNELEKRMDSINVDAILDSGYIEQMIEDNKWSLFPQIQSTERPDVVAAALYEGKITILVDNSPVALIVPTTLPALFQSPDDYYQRWMYSSFVRLIRLISIVFSLIMPSLYVAITSFHTSIIPTRLAYSIAASREGVPFPAFIEALIMELSLALLMESIVRLPRPIGATIGIVGGLIIGQAAVSAGIVSPIMIIIVSVTAISSFITSNYEITFAFRIIRLILIIAASIIGLYGIALGLTMMLIHLIKLKSFGIPYLSPVVNIEKDDLKDLFIKYPIQYLKRRPKFMNTGDKIRQK